MYTFTGTSPFIVYSQQYAIAKKKGAFFWETILEWPFSNSVLFSCREKGYNTVWGLIAVWQVTMYENTIKTSGCGRQDERFDLSETPVKLPHQPPLANL